MLQKDYILEIVGDFVDGVAKHLDAALAGDTEATGAVEQDVAGLLDLDPEVALTLSPDSLVTMMVLSGMGDSVAAYVAYALTRLADAYEAQDDVDTAALRHAQAAAVGEVHIQDQQGKGPGLLQRLPGLGQSPAQGHRPVIPLQRQPDPLSQGQIVLQNQQPFHPTSPLCTRVIFAVK